MTVRFVALLRGIKVGGRHKLAMAAARETLESLGCADVTSYIQSGNLAFSAGGDADAWASRIASALEATAGFAVPTIVLDAPTLAQVVAENPYSPAEPKLEHIVFHQGVVPPAERERLLALVEQYDGPSQLHVGARAVYLHTPEGFSQSLLVKRLPRDSAGTARNLATVAKLQAMVSAVGSG